VVWLAEQPIPGSPEAIARLRAAGERVLFLTNNSAPTVAELQAKLANMGIDVDHDDLVTSAQAAASLVEPGSTVLLATARGVEEAMAARGVTTVREGEADAVVVGFHRDFDYERLTAAFRAVAGGARLIGTNDDSTYPTPDGQIPGGGSLLAAVAFAAGVDPVVAGKPHEPFAAMVRARLGDDLSGSVMVGDRQSTDGLLAERLGVPFVLLLSGVTGEEDVPTDPAPSRVAASLAELVQESA
jgi:4-nitrophenyl phosphatase